VFFIDYSLNPLNPSCFIQVDLCIALVPLATDSISTGKRYFQQLSSARVIRAAHFLSFFGYYRSQL